MMTFLMSLINIIYAMFAYRRKNFKKRSFRRPSSFKSRARPKTALKRTIKAEITRSLEKKTRQTYVEDIVIPPSSNASLVDTQIQPVGPFTGGYLDIQQGVGNGSRIGNRITVKRCVMRGTVVPIPYDATTNVQPSPLQIKFWIGYDKTNPTIKPSPAVSNDFFQFNNTSVGFTNDLVDLWKPINTDKYRILASRQFKLGNAVYNASGALVQYQNYANNDFKYNCNFSVDLTKYLPKSIKYDDTDALPTNRGLFLIMVAVRADGTPLASNQVVAKMSYMLDLTYLDA